eukprot:gene29368-36411_t
MTARCRKFANQLNGRFNLPVVLVDERYSAGRSSTTAPPPSFCNNTLTNMSLPTNPTAPASLDAEALYAELLQQVKAGLADAHEPAIVGIHSGGAWLAERHVPAFGTVYYDPSKETSATPIHEQLQALAGLVKAGKVRYIGLSNETPYGVHEFVRLAEQHGLPRVAAVQNPYCLINRTWENAMDETCHRLNVSLLAYSPLGFGLLTGKYDDSGISGPNAPQGARIASYESVRKQRWGRTLWPQAAPRTTQGQNTALPQRAGLLVTPLLNRHHHRHRFAVARDHSAVSRHGLRGDERQLRPGLFESVLRGIDVKKCLYGGIGLGPFRAGECLA